MEKSNQFTWIKTYKELVEYLKNMKDRQKELISILEEVLGEKPKEKEKGLEFELEEIDPFTFLSYLNKRIREEKKTSNYPELSSKA